MQRRTMTVKEVAVFLGVSVDVVYEQVRKGNIPYFRVGRRILFRIETLEIWMSTAEENSWSSNCA
ncbi:helix-turn-helix domain-containing protein [Bacillus paranthracis]|uniref:helix-turn-helix domain-containing protein n=1 Tax=Bacillus cereus group TaxID=86661 RepID=UPI00187A7DFC|nr:helix-turn-helix domain-containing protein [Bacillus paranthracis]HDR7252621.1 helix-turn-helix domain-containing protein [Bacillus pacificus]HDT6574874.1 helix-turn-helix domain-containing protein [Bacillus cereus]MBE7116900.1 helix-turn-helix domain-containing protein [Bacillus paranthracis]MBE7131879.1 helix-turn-helix domain-containing protein [Bacillus paranthracis]MBE7151478.1 helix-turn-helix domain-containing protein [Bacillus paranthracis]